MNRRSNLEENGHIIMLMQKILIEELLQRDENNDIPDYKFFLF